MPHFWCKPLARRYPVLLGTNVVQSGALRLAKQARPGAIDISNQMDRATIEQQNHAPPDPTLDIRQERSRILVWSTLWRTHIVRTMCTEPPNDLVFQLATLLIGRAPPSSVLRQRPNGGQLLDASRANLGVEQLDHEQDTESKQRHQNQCKEG